MRWIVSDVAGNHTHFSSSALVHVSIAVRSELTVHVIQMKYVLVH